jgi:hypothetical protein
MIFKPNNSLFLYQSANAFENILEGESVFALKN